MSFTYINCIILFIRVNIKVFAFQKETLFLAGLFPLLLSLLLLSLLFLLLVEFVFGEQEKVSISILVLLYMRLLRAQDCS